jgi:phosphoglycerate kinase
MLVEKEITTLTKLKENPEQPFVVIICGNKIATKLPLLTSLIGLPPRARPATIIIGGAIAYEFTDTPDIKDLLHLAKSNNVTIMLPTDLEHGAKDINKKTIDLFIKEITRAKTIFFNGVMGIYEEPEHAQGTKAILEAVALSKAYTVIGGGDAVAATFQFGLESKMNILSTGGGATLAFLANQELPAWK